MLEAKNWYYSELLNRVALALKQNGFQSYVAQSIEDARKRILELIAFNEKVGVGGSVTIREIGIIQELEKRGNVVVHHWINAPTQDISEIRRKEIGCDVFLTSVNAITYDGKLVCIDGVGNRVAAMIFGPRKVIVVAGKNKLAKSLDEALYRAKNLAAVMNNKRIGTKNPCATLGYCVDCKNSERICRVTVILERNPSETDYHIILLPLDLGY
ncbi:MAG: lactate utilization protein [Thermoproteota archaeon]